MRFSFSISHLPSAQWIDMNILLPLLISMLIVGGIAWLGFRWVDGRRGK